MHAYEGSQSSFLNSMYRPNSALQPTNNQSYTSYKPQTDYPMAVRFDTHPLHSLSAYNSGSFSFYPCASSHRYVHDLNCSYTAGTLHSGEANSQLFYFSLALNLNSLDKKPIIKPKSLISRVLFFLPACYTLYVLQAFVKFRHEFLSFSSRQDILKNRKLLKF